MSASNYSFVSWEEHIICHERGSRVVHYYLKDALGNLILAVIGTERSIRHMIYVVADEFLEAYGSNGSINASTKWRARREVVDWLTSRVSRHQPLPFLGNAQPNDSAHGSGLVEVSLTGFSACTTFLPALMARRKWKVQNSEVEWSGIAWICTKQLKHYPAFCRDETTIAVHSFVFIMSEEESHYIGYLEDMYEDKKGQKKVKVRWFHHSREVKDVIPQLNPHPREVFITPHVQVISADCVDGLAIVLTPQHYEKCVAVVPHTSLSGIHMCFRQIKNNKVQPFTLTKMRGYSNQAIFSSLDGSIVPKHRVKSENLNKEDRKGFPLDGPLRVSGKRKRSSKRQQRLENGSGIRNLVPFNHLEKSEPTYPKLKLRLSRKTLGIEFVVSQSQNAVPFKVDEKIELLCQDSGIRGCWFRCKVLQVSQKRLKVQYEDIQDVEGPGNLEEWVPSSRVADPDKLGMRWSGRQTIRPCPPNHPTNFIFEVGAPVDAWWSDGWWEGVVSGVGISGSDCLQVYLPGECKFLMVEPKYVRISRDWVNNKWLDVKAVPDVLCNLSATFSSSVKLEAYGCGSAASLAHKAVTSSKLEAIEEDEAIPGSGISDDLENVEEVDMRQGSGDNVDDESNIHRGRGGHCDVNGEDNEEEEEEEEEDDLAASTHDDDKNDDAGNKDELLVEEDPGSANKRNEVAKMLEVFT